MEAGNVGEFLVWLIKLPFVLVALVLALALGAGGCAVSYETYPSDGAIGLQNPDLGSVRAVSGVGIQSIFGRSGDYNGDGFEDLAIAVTQLLMPGPFWPMVTP